MSTSSMGTLARAVTLAALLVVPTAVAFAADNAATPQSGSQQPRQQAQVLGTTAAAPAANGHDVEGDDPYAVILHRENLRYRPQAQNGLSNEPDWNGVEYQGGGGE